MHHIVYQSYAVGQPTTSDLKILLTQSRANNSRLNITGLLLYGNGSFLQVLEGEKQAVHYIYARIQADSRHTRVIMLADGSIARRVFQDWSMGFQVLSEVDVARLTGYIGSNHTGFLEAYRPSIDEDTLYLLKSFVTEESSMP